MSDGGHTPVGVAEASKFIRYRKWIAEELDRAYREARDANREQGFEERWGADPHTVLVEWSADDLVGFARHAYLFPQSIESESEFEWSWAFPPDRLRGIEPPEDATLSRREVAAIKWRIDEGESPRAVAEEFDADESRIDEIARGEVWDAVPPLPPRIMFPDRFERPEFLDDVSQDVRGKLLPIEVSEIKSRIAEGEAAPEIAEDYDVTEATIYSIKNGVTWTDVPPLHAYEDDVRGGMVDDPESHAGDLRSVREES